MRPPRDARLVAELRLEVVDHHRQLAVALDDVAQQERDDLLVGHRQDHVPAAAVLEPDQLRADLVVAAALPPDLGRVDDRHLHLLAADRVHLLADDLLDAVADALAERQQRVDPGAELADVAGPEQQPVRRHLGVGGIVAERGEEQVGQAHGAKDSGRAPVPAVRAQATVGDSERGTVARSAMRARSRAPASAARRRPATAPGASAGRVAQAVDVERLARERGGSERRLAIGAR